MMTLPIMAEVGSEQSSMEATSQPWALVTGFGPFEGHPANPSWAAVCKIAERLHIRSDCMPCDTSVAVIAREIPVSYAFVDDMYGPTFPTTLGDRGGNGDPLIVIHVGVNGTSRCVELERCASNHASKIDIQGHRPAGGRATMADPPGHQLATGVDLEQAIATVISRCALEDHFVASLGISEDAGKYLCNYVYYKACCWARSSRCLLSNNPSFPTNSDQRTSPSPPVPKAAEIQAACLFVHVPIEGRPHSIHELTCILTRLIEAIAEQRLLLRFVASSDPT
jgi:pyrrolidone-carboxylate peptidase